MRTILDLLRRKAPAKSAEIRRALAELATPDAGVEMIAALEARRRAALLDGLVGDDVEAIEREIADAVRERDRAAAFREELTARLAQAEQLEAVDALVERKLKAEVESRDLAKRFARFSELVDELVGMLRADQANAHECEEVNRRLTAMGSTDRVERATRPNFGISETMILSLGSAPVPPTAQGFGP